MINELKQEFDFIFDLRQAAIQPDTMRSAPELSHVITFSPKDLVLMAARYQRGSSSRYLSHTCNYAYSARAANYLSFSILPFDGPYHRHGSYELTYVTDGTLTYVMSGKEVVLHAGEAMVMDRNCIHFDRNLAGDAAVLFLNLSSDTFHTLAAQAEKGAGFPALLLSEEDGAQRYLHYRPLSPEGARKIELHFARMIEEINTEEYGRREMLALLACRLLNQLERSCSAELVKLTSSLKKDQFLILVDQYIQEHLSTVTAGDLVRQLHFNNAYFCRKVKQKYGVTITEYIQQRRIERARSLLIGTDRPVLDIIEEVGYKNGRYFYDLFKEQTGMTPAEYREKVTAFPHRASE